MVCDDYRRAGPADALDLPDGAKGIGQARYGEKDRCSVESRIGKRQPLGVHLQQSRGVQGAAAVGAPRGFFQHFTGGVYSDHLDIGRVQRQRQTGTDAHFQDALAGAAGERIDRNSPSMLEARSEYDVVNGCEEPVTAPADLEAEIRCGGVRPGAAECGPVGGECSWIYHGWPRIEAGQDQPQSVLKKSSCSWAMVVPSSASDRRRRELARSRARDSRRWRNPG